VAWSSSPDHCKHGSIVLVVIRTSDGGEIPRTL